ncbi:MAG: hypothetical protein E7047_03865 [Lentisphaerae bacterium]|nr:hypothetical protein [Lentisphaerota bacterium]
MSSLVLDVADAITAKLNGQTIAGEILTVNRALVVDDKIMTSRELRIVAVPMRIEGSMASRKTRELIITVELGIAKRCTKDEMAHMLELSEAIGEYLDGGTILNGNGRIIAVEYSPIYDAGIFLQYGCFFSIVSITVKVFK